MNADEEFLRRAIRLAMNGRGRVEPNPMVGCVLVKNHQIIGEGFHGYFGGPHAEPTALASCTESVEGATAYVTLEPCCHTNKKTPPCAPRLIHEKIARVVIGCLDPNPLVNGNGVKMLRDAGIQVDAQVLEAECKQLIAPFLAYVNEKRPYVTLKWAQSANGLVAGRLGKPVQITNDLSSRQVHLLRSRCDAIAVGTNTVLNDDPLLTARLTPSPGTPGEGGGEGSFNPSIAFELGRSRPSPLPSPRVQGEGERTLLRIILSNSLKFPLDGKLISSAKQSPVLLYLSESTASAEAQKVSELQAAGVEVIPLPDHAGHFSFADVLHDLHSRKVMHLLIEPGPTLARYMLQRGQADRIWIFRSPRTIEAIHGEPVSAAPSVHYPSTASVHLDGDVLTEYLNDASDVFFKCEPSADFVLAAQR